MLLGSDGILRQHRRMRILPILPILLAGACGGSSGNDNPGGGGGVDAAGSGSGMAIKISGTAKLQGVGTSTELAGVVVAAYANSDESTAVAMATTDAHGNYTLMVPAGVPLDGFLKATKVKDGNTTYVDTYLYPQAPLSADFD